MKISRKVLKRVTRQVEDAAWELDKIIAIHVLNPKVEKRLNTSHALLVGALMDLQFLTKKED